MNENNLNGIQNVNIQPSAPVTPQVPVAPAQPVPPVVPAAPVVPAVPKQPMDKKEVMKWIGVGCGIAIIVAVFLPFMSSGGESVSLIDGDFGLKLSRFIVIVLGLVAAFTHFFQKAKQLSYLTSAYVLGVILSVNEIIDAILGSFAGGMDKGFGWYILLIASLGILVLNIMDDLDEIKSLFGTSNPPTPKAPVVPMAPIAPVAPVVPVTPVVPAVEPAAPVAPVVPTVEPVVQATVVCTNCGQPKKGPMDQFCQSCGQKY